MNRKLIKIIKRKDAEAGENVATQDLPTKTRGEKVDRHSGRRIEDTVRMWINERRENKRSEDVSAFRKLFGEERLIGKTA